MAGIVVIINLVTLQTLLELRSTSFPLVTLAVVSGMPEAAAISGHLSREMTTTAGMRASARLATPVQRTATTGTTVSPFAVCSASTSTPVSKVYHGAIISRR